MKWFYNISMCTILGLLVVLSGCEKAPEVKKDDPNASVTKPAEKVAPKTLSFYLLNSETYDPAYAASMAFANVGQAIFEGLVKYKENSTEIEPALSTNWEISSDMKTYKFFLRKDVKFHDGSKFNADSVLYSFERQLKDKRDEKMAYASIFDPVTKIEKLDDYTVQIQLDAPQVTFLTNLGMYIAAPIISPESHKKDPVAFAQMPVGTGPYKMIKHEKEKFIDLDINEDYWGKKPLIKNVHIKIEEKDLNNYISELTNGDIDLLKLNSQKELDKLKLDKLSTSKTESQDTYYIAYNTTKAPFNNRDFREGVSHLLNRDELIELYADVYAEKAETLLPRSLLGYNSKIKAFDYNVTRANELLKSFPKNKEISIVYNYEDFNFLGKFVADSLAKVGIKSKVEYIEDKDFEERFKSGNFDIVLQAWQGDNGDPDNFMFILETSSIDGMLNYPKYSNPEYDSLVSRGRITLKTDDRIAIYHKAEEILSKEVPILPLYHSGSIYAYSKTLKNFYKQPSGVLRFMYFDKE